MAGRTLINLLMTNQSNSKTTSLHKDRFEKLADNITEVVGSTGSLVIHTILFVFVFALVVFGVSMDWILLFITTVVSLEAIYLAVFIQRSTNKQAKRLEHAIAEIRRNTVIHLKEPLDTVVADIDQRVSRIEKELKGEIETSWHKPQFLSSQKNTPY